MQNFLLYLYLFFVLFAFFPFIKFFPKRKERKIFVITKTIAVITAHNEEAVISDILTDCQKNKFSEIILIADACTDKTVALAEALGKVRIIPVEYHSKTLALKSCWQEILYGKDNTAIFFFFDADARIGSEFLSRAVPSFYEHNIVQFRTRNKNSKAWVARMFLIMNGYFFAFQEAMMRINGSGVLAGNGWGARALTMKQNAFNCITLTDDLEYTMKCKEKVYFENLVEVEDEKPESFIPGYRQRIRWMRGGFQVFFTNWKAYDYRKYYLFIFSLANVYYTLLFLQLRLPGDLQGILLFFGLLYVFNIFLYGSLLDMQDLKKLKLYDFITFPFFCLTSYPIVIWSLITWKSKKWYRPEHSGVRDGTKNLE